MERVDIANLALGMIGAKRITALSDSTEEARVINNVYDTIRDKVLCEHAWTFAQKRAALIDMTRTDQDTWVTATDYEVDDIVYDLTLAKYYICFIANTAAALFATDLAAVKWELYTDWVTATVYAPGTKVYNSGVEYVCVAQHTAGTFATDLTAVKWVATEVLTDIDDGATVIYYKPTDWIELTATNDDDALILVEGTRILSDTEDLKAKYTYQNDTPTSYSPQFKTALATRLASEIAYNITQSRNTADMLFKLYEGVELPQAMASDSVQGTAEEIDQSEWEEARLA
jgi:hypothetical protein